MDQLVALLNSLATLEPVVAEVADLLAKAIPGNQASQLITTIDNIVLTLQNAVAAHKASVPVKPA